MTIIIFIIILAILILVHEFGHFISAKRAGIRVDEFGIGFPPKIFSWKPKNSETTYSINLIPFGGFVKIFGEDPSDESTSGPDSHRSFVNKPKYIQIWVLAAGVIFNILFAWTLISLGFMSGLPMPINESNEMYARDVALTIIGVSPESPADKAGLKLGDSISSISLEGNIIENPNGDAVQSIISNSDEKEFTINIKRGDLNKAIVLSGEEGIIENRLAIGISMDNVGIVKFPFLKSIKEGTITTVRLLGAISVGLFYFFVDAFRGNADLSQVSGPVGIVGLVGDVTQLGFAYLLTFTAMISLHLAVLNLIPFPALDGGRILFVIIEAITRRPINQKVQNWMNGVGFALLLALMVIVTYSDITKLF